MVNRYWNILLLSFSAQPLDLLHQ